MFVEVQALQQRVPGPSLSQTDGVNNFFFFFWPLCEACGILVPQPGIEPAPPAVAAQSLNHWSAREVPTILNL